MSSETSEPPLPKPAKADPDAGLLKPDILRPFDWKELFGNDHPVALDLGAGDGGFALAYAQARPDLNVLAVERLLGRARKIARRAARQNVTNLRVLRLETRYVMERMCPFASVEEIHILFPDPWPKRRHWKNRILQTDFLEIAARALPAGGLFRFVTDHPGYSEWAAEVFASTSLLGPLPNAAEQNTRYPHTDFEAMFRAEGKPIHAHLYERRLASSASAQIAGEAPLPPS
ncbi:tRNA (guanine-N7-)-methyltransferase [Verrucomicrobium sp. GAS474]|uniref:tRNA (guanosine(46)-N7)-methyltransferase TrmB n=1 Tax=Verrucomicrobium sp. GAS474 TaxID=1882831 RepID=UPI000879ABE4|nr:tRNA (guanosine(46)-N7)-methyltransferase TrmB [Verrucomicrobium sp. GAS474]SDT96843.1 tRNA (guanine-N7-)-methyltransferase [Verrucomicrobium sp. GAS474]